MRRRGWGLKRSRPGLSMTAIIMLAAGIGATSRADKGIDPPPDTTPQAAGRKPQSQIAHFARQPRYLFGCGMIWADWRWPGDRAKWAYDTRAMTLIRNMGGTHVPINIPWVDIQREPGKWSLDYVDHQVADAEKLGLAMFAYMGLTPDWALPPEAPQDKPGIGYRFPPGENHKADFIAYCHKVAQRYKGRIKHYQFWNEPNGCSWVNDGCSNGEGYPLYTKWLKVWYAAMKEKDPDCVLGAGALDYHNGVAEGYKYLEGMYREGAKGYFDAFNIHPYDGGGTIHHRALEDTRRVMVAHGDGDKGIWISEYGWALKDEREKSERLTRTLEELTSPKYDYVTMANYLAITDPMGEVGYGLCDAELKPRPSYFAFKRFTQKYARQAKGSGVSVQRSLSTANDDQSRDRKEAEGKETTAGVPHPFDSPSAE